MGKAARAVIGIPRFCGGTTPNPPGGIGSGPPPEDVEAVVALGAVPEERFCETCC